MHRLKTELSRHFPVFVLLLAMAEPSFGGQVRGNLKLGGGYLGHPVGVASEQDATYATQNLRLAGLFDIGRSRFKIGYEGNASQFGNDTNLGSIRNGVGLEWFLALPSPRDRMSAGVMVAGKDFEELYELYDYRELYSYLALKKYLDPRTLLRAFVAYKKRDYDSWIGDSENFREPHGRIQLQRFFESRTTLGLAIRYGSKTYTGVAASEVWETPNLPSTSQLSTRLSLSQGLGTRVGLRGWFERRWRQAEYPHLVYREGYDFDGDDEIDYWYDLFDSPLLDQYAHDGMDALAAMKWLAPAQAWLEAGLSYGDHDFGSLLFPSDGLEPDEIDLGQTRRDEIWDYFFSITRMFPQSPGRPKATLSGGWTERDSTVDRYTYSGFYTSLTLSWAW